MEEMVIGDETIFNTVVSPSRFSSGDSVGREEGEGTTKRQKTNRKRTFPEHIQGVDFYLKDAYPCEVKVQIHKSISLAG